MVYIHHGSLISKPVIGSKLVDVGFLLAVLLTVSILSSNLCYRHMNPSSSQEQGEPKPRE